MDLTRVVPVPLPKEPVVLWGLGLKDLIWLALGAIGDLVLWPHSGKPIAVHLVGIISLSGLSISMAMVRYQGLSIPAWGLLASRFFVSPKCYIPK